MNFEEKIKVLGKSLKFLDAIANKNQGTGFGKKPGKKVRVLFLQINIVYKAESNITTKKKHFPR